MNTGFNNLIHNDENDNILQNLIFQLMESAIDSATFYAKSSGRDNLSGMDVIYGLQYEAHQFLNRPVNNSHPHYDQSDESDSDQSEESESDSDDIFTKSTENIEKINLMNHYHDTWELWNPENEIEKLLKKSVDLCILKY